MEAKALKEENARSIGQWLFEDIICRWGSLVKIVTDNGALFKKAVKWLEEKYGIKGVAISLSQTSFGHISINSPSILTVSMATESP